jgi:hypothetical protein
MWKPGIIHIGYRLDNIGSVSAGAGKFSLHHHVQNGSGACPASYPTGTTGSSLSVKWPGSEVDDLPPSSTKIKNAWNYTSTPTYIFMVWCIAEYRICLHGTVLS